MNNQKKMTKWSHSLCIRCAEFLMRIPCGINLEQMYTIRLKYFLVRQSERLIRISCAACQIFLKNTENISQGWDGTPCQIYDHLTFMAVISNASETLLRLCYHLTLCGCGSQFDGCGIDLQFNAPGLTLRFPHCTAPTPFEKTPPQLGFLVGLFSLHLLPSQWTQIQ